MAGDLVQAEKYYKEALSIDPDNADAYHFLGVIANQAHHIEPAVQLIRKALSLNPNLAGAHFNLGVALEKAGQIREAMTSYRAATTLTPGNDNAWNNLGNLLLHHNQFDDAAACYRKLLALKPKHVPALFSLGVALENSNHLDEAILSYLQAVTLKPDLFEAFNNLGNIFNRKGMYESAISYYTKALALRPDFPQGHNNLGAAQRKIGRLEDARASFEKALALNPEYAAPYNNLGNLLSTAGQSAKAMDCYEKALDKDPGFAQAHYNMGVELEQNGRLEAAVSCFRKAIAAASDHAEAYRHLANSTNQASDNHLIGEMETLYEQNHISAESKMHICFGLGKAYSDLKMYQKSFRFFREANRIQRNQTPYDITEDQFLFRTIKRVFTPEFISRHRNTGYDDPTPVFILGMPRSGTTLAEQILASHPQAHGAGELDLLSGIVNDLLQPDGNLETMRQKSGEAFAHAGRQYIHGLRAHSADGLRIVDKMPQNFLFIGLIRIILPKAKIIHCQRNPMDTCFSIFKTYFKQRNAHRYGCDLEELGRYYMLYQDLMDYWRSTLPGGMHELSYEDLVNNLELETAGLLNFCGLPWDQRCVSFHETKRKVSTASALQVIKPIYSDSVQLWKRYEAELTPLRNALLTD